MSDQPKWTPGPWRVDPLGIGLQGDVSTADGENGIAQAMPRQPLAAGRRDEEREANAHLIAAAPDLYAALEDVLARVVASDHWWMDTPDCGGMDVDLINLALAKARGQA